MESVHSRRLYLLFAILLDYPSHSISTSGKECADLLQDLCPDAAQGMHDFVTAVESEGPERMEERYTGTFDITPTTNLYVGYHLFGESFKRGAFLAKLHATYRRYNFSHGPELADHLSVLLRFASVVDDVEFLDSLFIDGVLPALEKVDEALTDNGPYGCLIRSLLAFVRQLCKKPVAAGEL